MRGSKAKWLRRVAKDLAGSTPCRIKLVPRKKVEVRHPTPEGGYNVSYYTMTQRIWTGWKGIYAAMKRGLKDGRVYRLRQE